METSGATFNPAHPSFEFFLSCFNHQNDIRFEADTLDCVIKLYSNEDTPNLAGSTKQLLITPSFYPLLQSDAPQCVLWLTMKLFKKLVKWASNRTTLISQHATHKLRNELAEQQQSGMDDRKIHCAVHTGSTSFLFKIWYFSIQGCFFHKLRVAILQPWSNLLFTVNFFG